MKINNYISNFKMIKMRKFFLLASVVTTLISCSKTSSPQPESPLDKRLDQIQASVSKLSLTVNYDTPWDTLVVQSGLDDNGTVSLDQNPGLPFPQETSKGAKTINVELVSFTDSIRTDTIMLWLQYKKLRPATISELLTYATTVNKTQEPLNLITTSLGTSVTQTISIFKQGGALGFGNMQFTGYPVIWGLAYFYIPTSWWETGAYGETWSFLCVNQ